MQQILKLEVTLVTMKQSFIFIPLRISSMETNGTFVVPTLVESGGNCSNIRQSFIFILDKEKNTNLATDATNQTTNLVFKAKLRNYTYTDR